MAKARKDERGRALRKGEVQRASDKRYMYTYTDPLGRRKFIYAQDLTTLREKEKRGSLLWVLDKTKTAMGARLLRSFIEQPLIDRARILKRQEAIEELLNEYVTNAPDHKLAANTREFMIWSVWQVVSVIRQQIQEIFWHLRHHFACCRRLNSS